MKECSYRGKGVKLFIDDVEIKGLPTPEWEEYGEFVDNAKKDVSKAFGLSENLLGPDKQDAKLFSNCSNAVITGLGETCHKWKEVNKDDYSKCIQGKFTECELFSRKRAMD
jgi:hypothetical protein